MRGSDARQIHEEMTLGNPDANVEERDWQPLFKTVKGQRVETYSGQK
jgi:hypothetical protein